MVGGAIRSPSGDSASDTRVLVLNLLWLTRGVTNTGQDIFVLDKAFVLIDGQKWDPTMWSSDLGHDEMGSLT